MGEGEVVKASQSPSVSLRSTSPQRGEDAMQQRLEELERMLDWKEKVFQRWVDMKSSKPNARIFKLLKTYRAKVAPLVTERNELKKLLCGECDQK